MIVQELVRETVVKSLATHPPPRPQQGKGKQQEPKRKRYTSPSATLFQKTKQVTGSRSKKSTTAELREVEHAPPSPGMSIAGSSGTADAEDMEVDASMVIDEDDTEHWEERELSRMSVDADVEGAGPG